MPWPPDVLNERDAQLSVELRWLVLLKLWIILSCPGWQGFEFAAGHRNQLKKILIGTLPHELPHN
jgi:hypothetical protein